MSRLELQGWIAIVDNADMSKLNVILPCAGEGSRLGLPYPKELHVVEEGRSLVEFSLERCARAGSAVDRVTIVMTAAKPELLGLLERWMDRLPVAICFFDDSNFEWPGSVLSAEHLFCDHNVVLLPDSHLIECDGLDVIPAMANRLESSDVVFGYVEEQGPRLGSLGALTDRGNEVSAFCDKPDVPHDRFNAFWTTFGFRGEHGRPLLEMMTRSVQRKPVSLDEWRVAGFPVAGYRDLGTWDSLREFQARRGVSLESAAS